MTKCPKCGKEISRDNAAFCPYCGAICTPAYSQADIQPSVQADSQGTIQADGQENRSKNKKPIIIAAVCAAVLILGIAATLIIINLGNHSKTRTFNFTCEQYTDEINKLTGRELLHRNQWVTKDNEWKYTEDSFDVDLDVDPDSKKVTMISVGPSDSEDAVKLAATTMMVIDPEMTQKEAFEKLPDFECDGRYDFIPSDDDPHKPTTPSKKNTTTKPTGATKATDAPKTEATAKPTTAPETEKVTDPPTDPTDEPEPETEPATEPPKTDWKTLYKERINDSSLNGNDKSYALAEIDGDGIPELVVDSVSHMAGKHLYWVSNGELHTERIDLSWGDFRYGKNQGIFWNLSNAQGSGYTLFSFENDTLTTLHTAVFTTTGGITYSVDKQETDKASYDAMVEDITSKCSDTATFYKSKSDILNAIGNY